MIKFALESKSDGLIIAPTGSGKSLCAILPSIIESSGITVMVAPYTALCQDLARRMEQTRVPFAVWRGKGSLSSNQLRHCRLLLVHVELACEVDFINLLKMLATSALLKRIIYDEAHIILLDCGWRMSADLSPHLKMGGDVPFIAMTATLSPSSEAAFFKKLGCPPSTRVIRASSTSRPNIKFTTIRIDGSAEKVYEAIKHDVESKHILLEEDRGIVFCNTVKQAELFSLKLENPLYVGNLNTDERRKAFAEWVSGSKSRWLVATSAFAFGVDYPHVRYVLFAGCPRDLVSFAQMSGRAGRDGLPASAIIYHYSKYQFQDLVPGEPDHCGYGEMRDFINKPLPCRRSHLSKFLDGHTTNCASIPAAELCDMCDAPKVTGAFFII